MTYKNSETGSCYVTQAGQAVLPNRDDQHAPQGLLVQGTTSEIKALLVTEKKGST